MATRQMPDQQTPIDIPGLQPVAALTAGAITVQKYKRGDGEFIWQHSQNRIALPLTGAATRRVTVQLETGPVREFIWNDGFGFYPATTRARIVSASSTSFHLLWSPNAATQSLVEPLLPFQDPFITRNAQAIVHDLESGIPDRLFVESLGNAIIIKLLRNFSPKAVEVPHASGLSRDRLRRIVEYIDAHLGEDLTLDAIAGVACLSPHHLSRSFHRAMGVGLHRYVVQRRIDRARHLVLESSLSMAEIAWMVGFGSQAAFTTRFRQEFGQSPARLRRGS